MTLRAVLHHTTRYRYDRPVELGAQVVRLRPAPHCRTPITSYSLTVEPTAFLNWQQDPFGNYLARVAVPDVTTYFSVSVEVVAELIALNPFDFFIEKSAEHFPFRYEDALAADLLPYLRVEKPGPRLAEWLRKVGKPEGVSTIDLITDLNRRLAKDIEYLVRMEPGVQSPEETLAAGSGSCRDSGWLLVHILRQLGLAARFVSGYLIQLTADQKSLDGPSGPETDFCDLHAWAEVYVPGAGWIGLDPTSGLLAGEGHLPLACTPEPRSAAPITGTLGPCEATFDFEMSVTRLVETPRTTKPYSETVWQQILEAGDQVDRRLAQGDVRLTMGGEPTFVSIDDMDGEEWNTAAVGPTKRGLAAQLVERLRQRFAPNGVVHFGQGKWYPGESLPRWAFGLFWREDGEPLWEQQELIAVAERDTPSLEQAQRFVKELARKLGVDPGHVLPGYEDPWHYAAAERRAAPETDPESAMNPEERARLARVLENDLGKPVCFVLPVQAWQGRDGRRFRSEHWSLSTDRLFLIPGDSPSGLRLPLEAILGDPADPLATAPQVPFDRAPPLAPKPVLAPKPDNQPEPPQSTRRQAVVRAESAGDRRQSIRPQTIEGNSIRTALSVEPRDGFLHLFVPPLPAAEDYAAFVAAVEETASELSQPVRLEGYEPPPDHRIRNIRVTPDPGVIEVNVAPASSWRELVDSTEALYEAARHSRLTAEKFMLDGRHTGTGGGNHVVLGGATPADSAFLRQPDLLASFVTFFNNHPSMSFLFSGLFIGPTSQAPRVDQARDDSLYELEIALAQVPGRDASPPPPWLVDRIFRDVLVDVTGNTHRTEICIDKLYAPESATGRLGLVEFRGFEMPPHPRMNLAQGLLMRALVAWFWDKPYRRPLQRWGTALHDRFMLPTYVRQDFEEVLHSLRVEGLPFDWSWFAPHFEFRFPVVGTFQHREVFVELRHALEPWHVTGEHGAVGGTSRYVDSSLERIEARVTGFSDARYVLTCNRRPLPLQPTAVEGCYAAGVRYRAWQPPHCLHPTIPVHAPLRFDLVDRFSGCSVAGASYHVGHPGGRNHERFPVNALEAEGRRIGRFSPLEHTGGALELASEPPNKCFPFTLDLRLASSRGFDRGSSREGKAMHGSSNGVQGDW